MAQTNKNNLGFLGETFQYKLVHEFMDNRVFFEDLSGIIDQNMFTDPNLKTFVGVMKNYYGRESQVPSYDYMEIELRDISHSDKEIETYLAVLNKIKNTPTDGVDRTRELAEKFFRQQNIVRTANEILKIAKDGNIDQYERCVGLLNEAITKGVHNDFGESVFDHLNETLSDDYRIPIPTGIGKIDETLEGGLGKGELGVIIGPTSFGKVQPFDSQIVTPSGFKNMGDIKVGDYVIGRNGKPTKVIGVFPHKNWQFYTVTFSDGVHCECGKEHLWAVNSLYQRSGKKYIPKISKNKNDKKYVPDHSFKVLSLGEIMEKGLFKRGRHNFKIPMCQAVEFDEKPLKIDPYLMGYMIGNGNFKRSAITVGIQDIEESTKLLKECNFNFKTTYHSERKNYSLYYRKDLRNSLNEYFPLDLTSSDKFIPKDYLFNSIKNRLAILNGLMDSDGTCGKNGSSCFNTKSKQLAEDIKTLVLSLGGFAKVREKNAKNFNKKYNELHDCGIHYEVTISLCDDTLPIFRLKRKQDRVVYRTIKKGGRFIEKVEKSRICDGQCIKVDSDEELYLTDDFIVTHNTSMTTAMASHAALSGHKVLQIVFEDRIKQIQRKHIGRLTGVEAKDLSKAENIELVKETLKKYQDDGVLKENLRIVKFPSGEKTARQIKAFIVKLINSGFKPDLVILDYFECLEHEGGSSMNDYEKEGKTMRFFEAMAGELDIAMWIPSQGTKDSINAELITMDKIGGSVKKAQIAHVILSIARTVDDIANNKATIAILKNRAGKSGKVFNNVDFNNGTCIISTDSVDEFDSLFAKKKNQEDVRQNLAAEIYRSTINNKKA